MNTRVLLAPLFALLLVALLAIAQEPAGDPALADPPTDPALADPPSDPALADPPTDPALIGDPAPAMDTTDDSAYPAPTEEPEYASADSAEQPADVPLFSQAELDQMLAPIALYPDELLSQVLMAATYPLELVEAARWSRAHSDTKGQDAVRAVEDQSWDPSVKSLVAFPDLLARMDTDLEWTKRLGDAFLAQQEQVMDTVQALRQRAEDAGNLESNDHIEVQHDGGTIVLQDRYPDVVYVPYYSPYEVYGTWWWPSYGPVYWDPWPSYYNSGYYWWGPSIWVGNGFYYGNCDWYRRQVRVSQTVPFYYRRPRPVSDVWVHEYRHRRGVPYRDARVHQRYAGRDAHPPRDSRMHRAGRSSAHSTHPGTDPRAAGATPRDRRDARNGIERGLATEQPGGTRTPRQRPVDRSASHPDRSHTAPADRPAIRATQTDSATRTDRATQADRGTQSGRGNSRPAERSYTRTAEPDSAPQRSHARPAQQRSAPERSHARQAPAPSYTPPAVPERSYSRPAAPTPQRSYERPAASRPAPRSHERTVAPRPAPAPSYSRPAAPQPSAPVERAEPRSTQSERSSSGSGQDRGRGQSQSQSQSQSQPRGSRER